MLTELAAAACTPAAETLAALETTTDGLTAAEAEWRRSEYGPNALR